MPDMLSKPALAPGAGLPPASGSVPAGLWQINGEKSSKTLLGCEKMDHLLTEQL